MNTKRFLNSAAVAGLTVLCTGAFAGTPEISWYTIDGGGVTFATGGSLELGATAGQPDAGPTMTGGGLELTGGFWFELVTGDCNADGGVTLFDYNDFLACVTGPGGDILEDSCNCFDFDSDLDIDLIDWSVFQRSFNGS